LHLLAMKAWNECNEMLKKFTLDHTDLNSKKWIKEILIFSNATLKKNGLFFNIQKGIEGHLNSDQKKGNTKSTHSKREKADQRQHFIKQWLINNPAPIFTGRNPNLQSLVHAELKNSGITVSLKTVENDLKKINSETH